MTKRNLIEVVPEAGAEQSPKYWKSLDHLTFGSEYQDNIHREFLSELQESSGVQRRDMLKLMGASFALAGASTACVRRPEEHILPYAKHPELIPGVPDFYATVLPGPYGAEGLLVESHEGRPTKIEGNPSHYSSSGAASSQGQASVLELYDPDRSRGPLKRDGGALKTATWSSYDAAIGKLVAKANGNGGEGLAILVDNSQQPTRDAVLQTIESKLPKARVFRWDALAGNQTQMGAETAFGGGARVHYDLSNAKRILALDSDLFGVHPEALKNAADYAAGRRLDSGEDVGEMNRLYAVEGNYSLTGTNADHRLRLSSSEVGGFLQALAVEILKDAKVAWPASLGDAAAKDAFVGALKAAKLDDKGSKFLKAVAKDLVSYKGASVITVGEHQPAAVHSLALVLNLALEGFGETFIVTVPKSGVLDTSPEAAAFAPSSPTSQANLEALKAALTKGSVDTLFVIGSNPAAAGGAGMAEALAKAKTLIHSGLYVDETAELAAWHVPLAHFLESWGDARAYDGQASIIQPLIEPLHGARSALQILGPLAGNAEGNDRKIVKTTWALGEKAWRSALHDGLLANSDRDELSSAKMNVPAVQDAVSKLKPASVSESAIEVLVAPDLKVLDGRYSNLGWLQELPDPITKLTWDNAVLVSPALAKRMKLSNKVHKNAYNADELKLEVNGATVVIPSFVLPGLAENTVVVHTGHGRQKAGDVGNDVGVSVQALQSGTAHAVLNGAKLSRTGKTIILASTQDHFSMDNAPYQEITKFNSDNAINPGKDRNQLRTQTASDYKENPKKSAKHDLGASLLQVINTKLSEKPIQMVDDPFDYNQGQQWGMAIDLNSCLGCGACVVACQAENNIPVVGREHVLMGRELHWNRTDRYFTGDVNDPTTGTMPIFCLHCENAPCEPVCPVAATVHGTEGLNSMVYNRCIGTRYCANNCPIKTRRFNYFDYSDSGNVHVPEEKLARRETLSMQYNPDVTVRYRGVMEKCTYCTQRIQEAKMVAKRKGKDPRNLPDGAVTPACAQTCATDAISFGNINDKKSKVAAMKAVDRNYELLKELNIRPRTSYLAKVRNINPELAS